MLEKNPEKRISIEEIFKSKWYLKKEKKRNTSIIISLDFKSTKELEKNMNSTSHITFKSSLQDLNKSSLSPPTRAKISCFKKSQDHILTESEDFDTKEGQISSNKYDLTPKLILDHVEINWDNLNKSAQSPAKNIRRDRSCFLLEVNNFIQKNKKKYLGKFI